MPNTGLFYLYEVVRNPCQSINGTHSCIESVRAECLACRHVFLATQEPALLNIFGGGAALTCPRCSNRQAISDARFADFVVRFPSGNTEALHGETLEVGSPAPAPH
jgi:hypothetical protein